MKKNVAIIILVLVIIVFLFRYFWFSDMESRIYVQKNYTKVSDEIFLHQVWHPIKSSYQFGFPYKKIVYGDLYTYSITFGIRGSTIDNIVIKDLVIILPNRQIDLFFNEDVTINHGGTIFNQNQIKDFTNTGIIDIIAIENTQIKDISLLFHNIAIPFEEVDSFHVKMRISLTENEDAIVTKDIISEFEREVTVMRVFPTA